jgi:hypothetical protein
MRNESLDSLDRIGLKPAKARLPINADQYPLRTIVSEAIRRVSSQKAAAADMGIDPAQLTRQLQSGRLTVERLEALGVEFYAELGRLLLEQYGNEAQTPQARARARLPEIIREILELTA